VPARGDQADDRLQRCIADRSVVEELAVVHDAGGAITVGRDQGDCRQPQVVPEDVL
jgi:hypothetical protein